MADKHLICPVFLTCVSSLYLLIWVTHNSQKWLPYLKYFAINLLYFTNNAQHVFTDKQLAPILLIMVKQSCLWNIENFVSLLYTIQNIYFKKVTERSTSNLAKILT